MDDSALGTTSPRTPTGERPTALALGPGGLRSSRACRVEPWPDGPPSGRAELVQRLRAWRESAWRCAHPALEAVAGFQSTPLGLLVFTLSASEPWCGGDRGARPFAWRLQQAIELLDALRLMHAAGLPHGSLSLAHVGHVADGDRLQWTHAYRRLFDASPDEHAFGDVIEFKADVRGAACAIERLLGCGTPARTHAEAIARADATASIAVLRALDSATAPAVGSILRRWTLARARLG